MEIAYLSVLVFVASIVGTTTGFGTSTVMVPVVLLFYPLPQTLLLVGIIHFFGNIWKVALFRRGFQWKLILTFGIPGIAAGFIGAELIYMVSSTVLSRILAVFIIAYVFFLFLNPVFKVKQSPITAVSGGLLSGFMAGIFGIGGAVRSLFLTAFNLPKEIFIATAGAIALFIDITRLTTYIWNKTKLETTIAWGMLIFIPISFIGAKIAKIIVGKIPQKNFRLVIAIVLLVLAVKMLIWPV